MRSCSLGFGIARARLEFILELRLVFFASFILSVYYCVAVTLFVIGILSPLCFVEVCLTLASLLLPSV